MIDFKGHRFEKDIILICVRWYLAYPLSYYSGPRKSDRSLSLPLNREGQ